MITNNNYKFSFLAIALSYFLLSACNTRCWKSPECLLASGPTTKIWTNQYYQKNFKKTDTLLSTKYFYALKDSLNHKSDQVIKMFLFYNNGLVLEENRYQSLPDTIHTYTEDLKYACCHAWTIGCYSVSNDTVRFATQAGGVPFWHYYKAKIYPDRLDVFYEKAETNKDNTIKKFQKRTDKTVIQDIILR